MLTCVVALLSAAAGFIVWEWTASRRTMVQNLSTQAEMIADNCKASLAFQDAKDAEKTLSALHVQPSIVLGCIYTNKGEVFASYHRKDVDTRVPPPELQEGGYSFGDGFLTVFRRIILDSEPVGTVCLRSDLRPMYVMLKRNTCIIIAVLLFASLVAYLMSTKLQKVISSPILSLADVAKVISEKKDYSNRALKHSNDEVGSLIDAFNEMLEQVQQRDFELVDAKVKLEMRVRERTAELSTANEQLEREVAERKLAQVKLQQHIKQLNCLYGLSKLAVRPQISLDQIFQETTEMIRSAYRYPDITCVRVTFNGIHHQTNNFQKSEISQHADIIVRGEKAGTVEIYCLEDRQENGEGLFLEEEDALLEAVCEKLGRIAELKQTTDKLRLFRTLIDQSNDCIFILEPKWGRFLDVNDRACKSLGYSRKELLEMSIKDIEEFPEGFSWQQRIEELKLKGDIIIQGRNKCKDGTRFFAETSLKFVKEEKEDYIIAVARDITARKQAEEALRESETRYKALFAGAPDGMLVADLQTKQFRYVNPAICRMFGYTEEELLRIGVADIHPKESLDHVLAEFETQARGEKVLSPDLPCLRKDGTLFYANISGIVMVLDGRKCNVGFFTDVTERKQMEEKLCEAEERFRIAAETSNDVVYEWDMQHSIQWFGKIDEMLGYGPGEFQRTLDAWTELVHPEDRNRVMAAIQAHLDGRVPYASEYRVRRKDGNYQWWTARGVAIRTPDGHPIRWIGTVTDITARKQAEEKLERAAEEWTSTFDSITDLISIQDKDFRYIRVNKSFADTFRMKPEEIVGKTCYELIHGRKDPWPMCPHKRALDDGKAHREEFFEPKLGIYIEVSVSPLIDEKGGVIGTVHIVKNITERKRAEEQLRKAEEKYRIQFEGTIDAIFIADAETGIIVDCNPAATELVEWEKSELIGQHQRILHPPERIEGEFSDTFKQHLKEKHGQTLETQVVTKNGEIKDVAIKASLIEVGGKKLMQAIFQDITDYKKAEERQAQLLKELESANRELKDFAYVASHDLKAPLRGIKTLAEWLSADYADKLGEQGKEQIGLLLRRVERMHNLIEGILQYSRVGRVQENRAAVNLNKLMSEIIDTLAPPANITITVENELPTIESELTRITQVFQNLMSNAIKYMDKPQGQIKVSCVEEDGFWKFGVADNGPGIEEKHFERIFQIFQTLSSRDDFESTGIGLTITKKIVELYGGKIWVESKVGEGSTFFFTLPKQKMGVKDENYETSVVS
jgi:PAS domain S-box-containing protein